MPNHRGFKKWHEMEQWWTALCTEQHQGGCPPFEPVTFTLNPPSRTHPSSAPCTRTLPAPSAGTSAAAGQDTAPRAALVPMPAPSPFCGGSSLDAATPTKDEPTTPSLHLNVPPRVTPLTRPAYPTGHARAAVIAQECAGGCESPPACRPPDCGRYPPRCCAWRPPPPRAPAPAADAPAPTMYGIRGVAVMYPTHASALAAARCLNLAEPKIMVTSNASKLEAWITMKKFVGEDEERRGQNSRVHRGVQEEIRREAKTEGLAPFWTNLFKEYWKLFPWDLPLDQDPVPNAPPPPPDLEPQTAEEALEQAERKSQVQKKIKEVVLSKAVGRHWDSREPVLRLAGAFASGRRRRSSKRTADFRFYMRHPDFKDTVMERFEEEYGEEPRKMHVSLRCQVAREMLEAETEEVKSRIKRECDEVHAKEVQSFNEDEEGEPDPDPAVQRECCEKFLSIVQPLLAGLHAYTGLTLNIIGGRINEETQKFETMSANSGLVGGKDWARWDPEGYSAMLKTYLKFIHAGFLGKWRWTRFSRRPRPDCRAVPVGPVPPPPDVFLGMNLLRMSEQDDVNEKAADGAVLRDGEGDMVMDAPLRPLVDDEDQLSAPRLALPTPLSSPPFPTRLLSGDVGIAEMTEALRLEIVELPEEARNAYTSRLRRMSSFELKREIHNAHNHRRTRGRSKTKSGNAKKRRKADDGVEQDLLSSDDDTEGDDDSGDESERGFATYPGQDERERAGVEISSRRQALEEAWNFASSTKSLPTTLRPKAVGVWVKNARKGVPKIGLSGEMEDQWWAWWKGINPSWRCPGQNGLLNVVITLKWWHGSMETPSEVGSMQSPMWRRDRTTPPPPPPIARPTRHTERPPLLPNSPPSSPREAPAATEVHTPDGCVGPGCAACFQPAHHACACRGCSGSRPSACPRPRPPPVPDAARVDDPTSSAAGTQRLAARRHSRSRLGWRHPNAPLNAPPERAPAAPPPPTPSPARH
ncbi:hypothetical protein B0H14DRAFT_3512712 [Mycena olivaceomarginata]|nr:hypothetical protein B0H14DRAFT_3512712 [Mycena olivaceomarginata]